jgi:hypothetical protein
MPDPNAAGLTAEQITTQNPAAAEALRAQGAEAERKRAADVRAQSMPGHEALIERMACDGKTTGAEAAMAVLAAERQARQAQAAARAADAPAPLAQDTASDDATAADARKLGTPGRMSAEVDAAALDRAARAYMAQHPGTAYLAAVKAVQAQATAA